MIHLWWSWVTTSITAFVRTTRSVRCPVCDQQVAPGDADPHVINCSLRDHDYRAVRRVRREAPEVGCHD